MTQNDYWTNYWKTNKIVENDNIHSKVGRTIAGVPISKKDWDKTLKFLAKKLFLTEKDLVLDLGAGSGAISLPFSRIVSKVYAVDISKKLLSSIPAHSNIVKMPEDIRHLKFKEGSFSKIIFYFAIQHLSEAEAVQLFEKMYLWLKKGGAIYIGDIPDQDKLFEFFNTKERKNIFYQSLKDNKPIIGTWFTKKFFLELAKVQKFKSAKIIVQPKYCINSHYRFDLLLKK